jgi:hypothetical protein
MVCIKHIHLAYLYTSVRTQQYTYYIVFWCTDCSNCLAIASLVKSLKVCPSPFAMLLFPHTIPESDSVRFLYYLFLRNIMLTIIIRLITIISIPAPIGVVMIVTTPSESPLITLGAMKKE